MDQDRNGNHKVKWMLIDCPTDLHRRFKAQAAYEAIRIPDLVNKAIEQYLARAREQEQEASHA